MAKKKRRYAVKKSKPSGSSGRPGYDNHHLLYQRRHWTGEYTSALRRYWYCIVKIPKDTLHHQIHEFIGDIPKPKECNARDALDQLRALNAYGALKKSDPIELRLAVLASFFDCVDQPTADALRAQKEIVCKINKTPDE